MNVGREEPNFVADTELDSFMLCIVVPGLGVLCAFDVLDKGFVVLDTTLCKFICSWGVVGGQVTGGLEDLEFGMIAVVCKERGALDSSLPGIVVCKLGEG